MENVLPFIILSRELRYLNSLISSLYLEFYGFPSRPIRPAFSEVTCSDRDNLDLNTIPHTDRFLPTLKAFYFPHSVDTNLSPFTYYPTSGFFNASFPNFFEQAYKDSSNLSPPFKLPKTIFIILVMLSLTLSPILCFVDTSGIHFRKPFISWLSHDIALGSV